MNTITSIPKEIGKFIAQRQCPLCQTSLSSNDKNIINGAMEDAYFANTGCFECDDYTVEMRYTDPKHITLDTEWLSINDEDYWYHLIVHHQPKSMNISIYLKDENPENDPVGELQLDGHPLEISRVNKKQLMQEIRTLLILA